MYVRVMSVVRLNSLKQDGEFIVAIVITNETSVRESRNLDKLNNS